MSNMLGIRWQEEKGCLAKKYFFLTNLRQPYRSSVRIAVITIQRLKPMYMKGRTIGVRLFSVAIILMMMGCDGSKKEDPEAIPKGILLYDHPEFGKILTDSVGNVLYFFVWDVEGTSSCSGNCLNTWPIYYSEGAATDKDIDPADIGVIIRQDGDKQTTYKGWPLYYYANDLEAGQTLGDQIGNNWFVAKPDYTIMLAQHQWIGRNGDLYQEDLTEGEGLSRYLVDANGRTLYSFRNDQYLTNTFTNADFSNNSVWPIYEIESPIVPSLLNVDDFSVITVFGRSQLTFKGWPIYQFGQDEERGQTKGVDVPTLGVWPILKPDSPEATMP